MCIKYKINVFNFLLDLFNKPYILIKIFNFLTHELNQAQGESRYRFLLFLMVNTISTNNKIL